jgi:hypothetical protein
MRQAALYTVCDAAELLSLTVFVTMLDLVARAFGG